MGAERRRHRRVPVSLDGQWRGTSGGGLCRIANLSLGGCFLRASTPPAKGEDTVVTLYFQRGGAMVLQGQVVHIAPPTGFAVHFTKLTPSLQFQLDQHMAEVRDM
jgi:hypothetical protein